MRHSAIPPQSFLCYLSLFGLIISLQGLGHLSAQTSFEQEGMILATRGDYTGAEQAFAKALQANPGNFRLLYNRALANHLAKEHEKAKEILQSVGESDRNQSNYQSLLADVHASLGENKEAVLPYKEAIKLSPADAALRLRLGATYLKLRQGQEATEIYLDGRKLFPDRPEFLLGLGVVEEMQAKFRAAVNLYSQVVQLYPGTEWGYLFLANAQIRSGQPKEAEQALQVLLTRFPNSALGHYLTAEAIWTYDGTKSRMLEHVQKALTLNPKIPECHLLAAKVALKDAQPREAARHLKKTITLDPDLAKAYYLLAQAYRRMGETQLAQEAAAKFSAMKENSEENQIARRLIMNQ